MTTATTHESATDRHAEAFAELIGLARRTFHPRLVPLLAGHVLALYDDADWPVHRGAMEALVRRAAFADRDGLRVAKRPAGGAPFGDWETRRPRSSARPYRTRLVALAPLRGSCDCPDFGRASLGLCKHLLVVLADLAGRERAWTRAERAAADEGACARLAWDGFRPLVGAGDWLESVRLVSGDREPRSAAWRRLAPRFARSADGHRVPRSVFANDPAKRLALVEDLAAFARRGDADPALVARLADEREELARRAGLTADRARHLRALRSLRRKLYPYQLAGVKRFLERGALLLADDMGLGKTAQATAIGHALLRTGTIRRGLLIVPAALKPQWEREWGEFSDAPIAVVDGSREQRAALYSRTKSGFLVANYEQVLRDLELMQRWKPELVVLDEAQRIRNWATRTARLVKELRPRYRLVLTGTPMENRLEELASIFDWVDDHALEPKWRLVPWHTTAVDGERGIIGARNLDTLRERLAPHMERRTRGEVLDELPELTETAVPITLSEEQRDAHDELAVPIASMVQRAKKRPLRQEEFLRLMQLLTQQRIYANGMAQAEFEDVWPTIEGRRPTERLLARLGSPKLAELREILAGLLEQGRKVVVFSQWRRMLLLAHWAVGGLLRERGERAVFFTGAEGTKRRVQNVVDFHDDPEATVFFASDAGGVGLNLQKAASACVHLELPWNPAVLAQRTGRIHRLGQRDPVQVYCLVARDCIEERIAGLVRDKRELFRGLFDGASDEVLFERSGGFLQTVPRDRRRARGRRARR